jgi:hypothetical protein
MRHCARHWGWKSLNWKPWGLLLGGLLVAPVAGHATTCTTQAEMNPQDRDTLASAGQQLGNAVVQQDFSALQGVLLPAMSSQWEGMREVIEQAAPIVKGGRVQLNALYQLDASTQAAVSDAQFFCSNTNGSLTVTISMRSLPPGKYAVVLAYVFGAATPGSSAAPIAGQLAFILALDANQWKLGGVFIRPGIFDGHDGVWYWERARDLSKSNSPWSAWFFYEAARYLLVPVDFLSSPNLEKLGQEQAQIKDSPAEAFPYSLPDGARTWKIDSVHLDASLRQADLAVTYESTGVTDPAAVRTEATAVLSALLKAQPALRQNFHGLWAYSSRDGKVSPVMELPMNQIP